MEHLINILTGIIYLAPSLLVFTTLIILARKIGHYSVILMIISTLGKALTDIIEFLITFNLVPFKTDFIIPFFKILQSFSLLYAYIFGIGFLIFVIQYKKRAKKDD